MLLSPLVLGLVACTAMTLSTTLGTLLVAFSIAVGWDHRDGGERQIARERRAVLVGTALRAVCACQILGLLLLVAVVDRLHPLITGAMCAAGVLAANPWGYPALGLAVAGGLAGGVWLAADRGSCAAAGAGLMWSRVGALAGLAGLLTASALLQVRFFARLDPAVITSCCATLFNDPAGAGEWPARLAGLTPPRTLFAAAAVVTVATGWHCRRGDAPLAMAVASAVFGLLAVATFVAWVTPVLYGVPTHRCPFCLLSSSLAPVGIALYACLGLGVISGLATGVVGLLRRVDPLRSIPVALEGRLARQASLAFVGFTLAVVPPLATVQRLMGGG